MRGDLCLCTGIKSTFPFGDLYLDATSYAPPFRRYLAGDRAGDLANLLSDESLVPGADNGQALFACFPVFPLDGAGMRLCACISASLCDGVLPSLGLGSPAGPRRSITFLSRSLLDPGDFDLEASE